MKYLISSVLIWVLSSGVSSADILKIETNDWNVPVKLVWSCVLEKIDLNNGLASFSYINNGERSQFDVNVTRIYSLVIGGERCVNREFPRTRADLKTALSANPRSRGVIELTNENFVGNDIPSGVCVRPNKDAEKIYLTGIIKQVDQDDMLLSAKANDRTRKEFTIKRSNLLSWVR